MVKLATLSSIALATFASARAANADPQTYYVATDEPPALGYAWNEPRLSSGIGVGLSIGGGISGFTDSTMRNSLSSNVAGLWDARLSLGTHVPIGLDVSYVGIADNLSNFGGASNGTLVGTTAEAALRFNILPHYPVDPYIFAGVGWERFDVTNMKFATSDTGVKSHDNVAEFPMGAGISFRDDSGWLVDVRGTFRAATNSTLVLDQRTGTYADLHSWEAAGAVGYEF